MSHQWGYGTKNGPNSWGKLYPVGNEGPRQSPINIVTAKTKPDPKLEANPLEISYDPLNKQTLSNSGHGWQVDYTSGASEIRGGPLEGEYALAQYHCHWGREDSRGSEHTVDGERCAAEIHLVHYNKKYGTFGEAADKPDGLAVIGLFVKVGKENKELLKVTNSLKKIKFAGNKTEIAPTDPDEFMPASTARYWTYEGSLTTPPLYESVTWIVLAQPTEISEAQLGEFRHLMRHSTATDKGEDSDDDDGTINDNFRPAMDMGSRLVRSCNAPIKFSRPQK